VFGYERQQIRKLLHDQVRASRRKEIGLTLEKYADCAHFRCPSALNVHPMISNHDGFLSACAPERLTAKLLKRQP
jgi:hypothetical protein